MRTMITGALGFVGRHLVRELLIGGHEVLATDRYETPPSYTIGEIESVAGGEARRVAIEGTTGELSLPASVLYRRCDLLEASSVASVVDEWAPRAVIHLAAQSSAGDSFRDPRRTLETNILGTLGLLEAMSAQSSRGARMRLLSVCSSEEYGRRAPEEMPLGEASPIEPASPYAVSKAAQGMLSLQYGLSRGLEVIVTRSFAHTGPGQTDRFVLPAFAKQCAAIRRGLVPPVVRVGNLDVVRDYLDVRDVVRAYRSLLEAGAPGEVYNVCSGRGLRLEEALRALVRFADGPVDVTIDPELLRPVDVPVMIGDNAKLRRETGWESAVSTERMLEDLFHYWDDRVVASTERVKER